MLVWKDEKRKIADLKAAEYNPRQLTKDQATNLNNSLTKFSLAAPLIINVDNTVIGGHQRLNLLKEQQVTEVDVRVPDRQLTPEEEQELNLRLNQNLGEWDFDKLLAIDEPILKDVGFSETYLDWIKHGCPDQDNEDEGSGLQVKKYLICPNCMHEIELKGKKNGQAGKRD